MIKGERVRRDEEGTPHAIRQERAAEARHFQNQQPLTIPK
jgi:hypothetical protein